MTWVKALRISSMYIQWKSAIHIPLSFKGTWTVEKALLDSGATENFLDRRTVARLKLPTKQLKDPQWIYNMDGCYDYGRTISYLFSSYLISLAPSSSVPFSYVPYRSTAFCKSQLLSRPRCYVFPSAAVFPWWTLTSCESLDFPSFVSNVLVYSVSDRWRVLTHYSVGTSRSL
jgi:hypothetical protein